MKAYIHGKMYEAKSDICFLSPCVRKRASVEKLFCRKSRCLFVFAEKCVLKNKITCRETSLTGTGTAQLPEKSDGIRSRCAKGYPKKRRSYERKFKQISGTAAVGVHDHEPDCQRISRYAGKSSTDRKQRSRRGSAAEQKKQQRRQNWKQHRQKPRAVKALQRLRQKSRSETPAAPAEDRTPAGSDGPRHHLQMRMLRKILQRTLQKTVKRLPIPQKKSRKQQMETSRMLKKKHRQKKKPKML